jgi:hypothetical protein
MTITAVIFRLSSDDRSRTIGWALLCQDVRYASIWWTGAPRAERRHLADWRSVEAEIGVGLPAGALARDSAIVRLFNADGADMHHMTAAPIEIDRPELAAPLLDARLEQLVLDCVALGLTR